MDTTLRPLDDQTEGIDISVRYGADNWSNLVTIKLLDEAIYPVCSPALLKQIAHPVTPEDLSQFTLIHDDSMPDNPGFPT